MSLDDLVGKRFSYLTVNKLLGTVNKQRTWDCICDCGNHRAVTTAMLQYGHAKSCGKCNLKHQTMRDRLTMWHGPDEKRLSLIFKDMYKRCYNQNCKSYRSYGGRGIYICDEWLNDRKLFVKWSLENGYSQDRSIDRIDVNGPYAPWNCRWVSNLCQANNKRNSRRVTTTDGTSFTVAEWARIFDMIPLALYKIALESDDDIHWFVNYKWEQLPESEKTMRVHNVTKNYF